MIYVRRYELSSAHFNNTKAYEDYFSVIAKPNHELDKFDAMKLLKVLDNLHGHNFIVTVTIAGSLPAVDKDATALESDWLIDDVELTHIVERWQNCNLSTHTDFVSRRLRATTERMAELLVEKIEDWIANYPEGSPAMAYQVSVRVEETRDIQAECP